MLLGGRHRVFHLIGLAGELRKSLPIAHAEGASAGAIASVFALRDADREVLRGLARDFDLASLIAVAPDAPAVKGLDRYLGRSDGSVFVTHLERVLSEIGVSKWVDLRARTTDRALHGPSGLVGSGELHSAGVLRGRLDSAADLGDCEDHQYELSIRVSAIRLVGRSLEVARELQQRGVLAREVLTQLRTPRGLDLSRIETRSLPVDFASLADLGDKFDEIPVADWLVHSARHPLAFRPELIRCAKTGDALLLTDGALPWNLRELRRFVPARPTVLVRFGSDPSGRLNFRDMAKLDRENFPGFLVMRLPEPRIDNRGLTGGVRFDLGPEVRERLFDQGVAHAQGFPLEEMLPEYLERWAHLREHGLDRQVTPTEAEKRADITALSRLLGLVNPQRLFGRSGSREAGLPVALGGGGTAPTGGAAMAADGPEGITRSIA